MKTEVSFELPSGTVIFRGVDLPDGNTPLPPTNATLHVFDFETGYGTPDRRFSMICGMSWKPGESNGQHKYFFEGETHWYKHVNCPACLKLLGATI